MVEPPAIHESVKYRVRPGNIPSVVYVEVPGHGEQCFLYMGRKALIEPDPIGAKAGLLFERLPLKVRAQVSRHFENIFEVPVACRSMFLSLLEPVEVFAEDYPLR